MYKVLVTARSFGRFSQRPVQLLEKAGCTFIYNPWPGLKLEENQLLEVIGEADAIICGEDSLTEKVIQSAPNLKVIAKFGVGVDKINLKAATERGIAVCNTPGANNESVADMAFALILGVARKLPVVDEMVRQGKWQPIIGSEVFGKTLGIVGLGKIGKAVAKRARGFDLKLLAYDEYPDKKFMQEHSIEQVTLEQLLQQADIVSLHVPSCAATKGLIGASQLALMKPDSYLINTSRGDVIDEAALLRALEQEQIAGAGLDVFASEPPEKDNPLLTLKNVVIAPHIAAHTVEAIDRMGLQAALNALDVLQGNKNECVVNVDIAKQQAGGSL